MKHVNHALDSTRELCPFLAGLGHKMAKDNYSPQKILKQLLIVYLSSILYIRQK